MGIVRPGDPEPFVRGVEPSVVKVVDRITRIQKAAEKVSKADAAAASARRALRDLMQAEIDAGRTTKSAIARGLGVSRQRVQKMLE
jgi:hypothetical protein